MDSMMRNTEPTVPHGPDEKTSDFDLLLHQINIRFKKKFQMGPLRPENFAITDVLADTYIDILSLTDQVHGFKVYGGLGTMMPCLPSPTLCSIRVDFGLATASKLAIFVVNYNPHRKPSRSSINLFAK